MAQLQVIKGGGGEAMGMGLADYIWVGDDGGIYFKKKTILVGKDEKGDPVPLIQRWGLSGCGCLGDCTAPGSAPCPNPQEKILSPCFYLPDPTRPQPCYIVLCEIRDATDQAQGWRSKLRKAQKARGPSAKLVWFGFEQDYSLESGGEDSPDLAERQFLTSERHIGACFDAGLLLHSAWNMPGCSESWDFKVGVRGFPHDLDPDPPSALVVADHLVIAQYLMEKVGAEKGLFTRWLRQSVFVSTAALREPGGVQMDQAELLKVKLAGEGRTLRSVPHPINGGCHCVEVNLEEYMDPYRLALDVLEAVWPLAPTADQPAEDEGDPE
jgi:hypothetical protein